MQPACRIFYTAPACLSSRHVSFGREHTHMLTQEHAMRGRDDVSIDRDGDWNCFCSEWMFTATCPHCKGTFTLYETWAQFCPACGGEIGITNNTRHNKDALLFEHGFLIDKESREWVDPAYAGTPILRAGSAAA